jgi:2-keto-4-pentenoate hydratase/2-oxohepta-3-ene-1,7-dioic acid hydratase in catechol pathway
MRLCSFRYNNNEHAGVVENNRVYATQFPTMIALLETCQNDFSRIEKATNSFALADIELLACVPRPTSLRDFYAFEAHVKNARTKRGLDVPPEWYEFPVFYFSNHNAVLAPFADAKKPRDTSMLDYELELACVIGKSGINISRADAIHHIAGYCIMNDWSARDVQMREVKVGLGPAKAKDFATTLGGELVTHDELADVFANDRLDLEMRVFVNGKRCGGGNFKSIHFSFAEMIERASHEARLYAGDVIGSGTVGTGCLLELDNAEFPYLNVGDTVEMFIDRLGVIGNRIV